MPDKLQRSFLFLALSVPLCLILGRAVADIALCLVGVGFLCHSYMNGDWHWLRLNWVKALLVTWVYLILCGALSLYDVKAGMLRGLSWGRFPLFTIAFAIWLLPLDRHYVLLRRSLALLLALTCLDALVQFFNGISLTGYSTARYAQRLTGPFKDAPVVGIYLTHLAWPAIGLAFLAGVNEKMIWKRTVPYALIALLGLTILLSGERVAFALFALSGMLFWAGAKKLRLNLFILGATGAAIAMALIMLYPRIHNRFVTTATPVLENFTESSYGIIFGNALQAWKLAPLTGVGPKNFHAACMAQGEKGGFKIASPWEPGFNCARHPHNLYLEWLAETGLIGFGLFLGLIFTWSRQLRQNLRLTPLPHYYAALGFGVSLVSFLWPVMATMSFFINWGAILFWWVLGLVISIPKGNKSE